MKSRFRNLNRSYNRFAYLIIFVLLLSLLAGTTGSYARDNNYRLVTATVDSIAAAAKKKAILDISNDLFIAGAYQGGQATGILYRLLPPPAGTSGRFPLIVIFHNSGRIGTDNTAQLDVLSNTGPSRQCATATRLMCLRYSFPYAPLITRPFPATS